MKFCLQHYLDADDRHDLRCTNKIEFLATKTLDYNYPNDCVKLEIWRDVKKGLTKAP